MPKKLIDESQESQEQNNVPKVKKVAKTGAERIRSYRERIMAMETEIAVRSAANVEGVPIQTISQQSFDDNVVDINENQRSLTYDLSRQSSQNEKEDLRNSIAVQPKVHDSSRPFDCVNTIIGTSPTTKHMEISHTIKNESSEALNLQAHSIQDTLLHEEIILSPQSCVMDDDRLQSDEQDFKFIEEKHKELKKELKRKKNRERQRAYYHRQKDLKKNEGKQKKKPKTNAERQREFRQRRGEKSYRDIKQDDAHHTKRYRNKLQLKQHHPELNSSLPMDEDRKILSVSFEIKEESDHHQDIKCNELIVNQLETQTEEIKPLMQNKTQQEMSPTHQLFEDPYEEHSECSMPNVLSRQDTNLDRDVSDVPTKNEEKCEKYSDHNQTEKIISGQVPTWSIRPSNILDSEMRIMTLEPSCHNGIIRLKKTISYNTGNQVGDNMCISNLPTPSQESHGITKQVKEDPITHEEWSLEDLILYAHNYSFRNNKIITMFETFDTSPSGYEDFPRWRVFRMQLFKEIRRRVHDIVAEGGQPHCALKYLPFVINKLVHRFNLLKLALQIELCDLDGPVCSWAVQQLVIQLANAVDQQCRKVERFRPRAITAQALAPAVIALQKMGINVKCTRNQLVSVWQRLCALKTKQLYKLSRAGDKPDALPLAEQLDAHDWSVLDTLLLHDDNQKMELVTKSSLQSLECYRSLVVLMRLQMKLPLWVRCAPPWKYIEYHGWPRIHARYNATGRTASIILLQRRWYQLRSLTRAAVEDRDTPLHPLFQLVSMEFPSVGKERKNSWSELVRRGYCHLVGDKNIAKQEQKRTWYHDIEILENLETVNEINEYLSKRIALTFSQERHRCGFWEQCKCFKTCDTNIMRNIHNALDTILDDDKNVPENTIAGSNVSKTVEVATLEALERINPTTAQVIVVVENEADEAVSTDITSVKDSGKMKTYENELSGSQAIYDGKQSIQPKVNESTKVLPMYINKKLRDVENLTRTSPNTSMPLDFTGRENEEASEPKAMFKHAGDNLIKVSVEKQLNCSETDTNVERTDNIENKSNFDITIDNKLLYVTHVKLTRIDETSAWVKHATNNNINLKSAGLLDRYDDPNKLPVSLQEITIDNESTIDDSGIIDDCKDKINSERESNNSPIFKGVPKDFLKNGSNQTLFKLCKPALVKLRKLKVSEIPKRGRVVKKIELPDIDEVRRINSNILTAQVKPISKKKQKRDNMSDEEEPEGITDCKCVKLTKQLRLLQKDIKALFILKPVDLEAIVNEAVNSDENKLLKAHTESNMSPCTSSNVFLDGDEEIDQKKPVHIKRKPKKKKKKDHVIETIEEPIQLNAYEEWERQKQIANKYFEFGNNMYKQGNKKPKRKTVDLTENNAAKEPKLLEQKQLNVTAELAPVWEPRLTEPVSAGLAPVTETRLTDQRPPPVSAEFAVRGPRLIEQGPPKESAVTESFQNVLPRPPITMVNTSNENNLQHIISDTFLTKLLNAPTKEPSVDNLRYMILSPMEKTNQIVEVGDIMNLMTPVEVEADNKPEITPMITDVCSLAKAETVEDNVADVPDTEIMETMTTKNSGYSNAGGRNSEPNLTMCLTPTHRRIMVQVGDQLVCNTTEAMPIEVSSHPNNAGQACLQKAEYSKSRKRGQSTGGSHTLLKNNDFDVEGGKYCGTGDATSSKKRKCEGEGALPHVDTELTTEFTTPEEYVKTDRRKLLTVMKLELLDPAWVIGEKYVILTEKNLPCSFPGYCTIGRDPPGRCQFLLWPNTYQSSNDNDNVIDESNPNLSGDQLDSLTGVSITEYLNDDGKVNDINVDRETNIFSKTENVGEVIVNGHENIIQLSANDTDNLVKIVVNENECAIDESLDNEYIQEETVISNKQDTELLASNALQHSKVFNNHQCHVRYEDDSDSDSESNRLQIVEDVTDFNNANVTTSNFNNIETTEHQNDNSDDVSKEENNLKRAEQYEDSTTVKVVDKNNLSDHTYLKSKDTDTNINKSKGMIKVKSFASISRLETQPLALKINENPDVIEKDNKYYKKLLEPSSPASSATYALMLSMVTNAEQCDRLLRERTPLLVLERYRGRVHPLKVCCGGPGGSIHLSHYDSHFLDDLVHRLRDFNDNYVQMYECEILD